MPSSIWQPIRKPEARWAPPPEALLSVNSPTSGGRRSWPERYVPSDSAARASGCSAFRWVSAAASSVLGLSLAVMRSTGETMTRGRRDIARYVAQLLGGEVINRILRFGATVTLARSLSASDFGLVNVGIACAGIGVILCSLGLPDLGAREVAIAPSRVGWVIGRVLAARLVALAGLSLVVLGVTALVRPAYVPVLAVVAAMAMMSIVAGDWAARGLERMSIMATASAMGGLTIFISSFVVGRLSGGATLALVAFALADGVTAAVLWLALHRFLGVKTRLRGIRPMLRRARPLALSSLALYTYYANVDTLILALSHSNREAGFYSAPYRLFVVLNLVGAFAGYAMLPTLSRLAESGSVFEAEQLVRSILTPLAAYGIAVLGFAELAGGDLLALAFGSRFRVASSAFLLLLGGVAWNAVGFPAGYSLIARGRNRYFLHGAATASIVGLGLDVALIPPLGLVGAGLATLLSFAAAALVWLFQAGLVGRRTLPLLGAILVTTCLAGIAVLAPETAGPVGIATCLSAVGLLAVRVRDP